MTTKLYGDGSAYIIRKQLIHRRVRQAAITLAFALVCVYGLYIRDLSVLTPTTFILVLSIFAAFKILDIIIDQSSLGYKRATRGLKGEQWVFEELSKLPSNYSVFRNIKVKEYLDVDLVVVGPTGVFAVEVKNVGGYITHEDGRRYTKWLKNEFWFYWDNDF